ncbi:MAG: F0F1 ATP synthase subunit C [Pseudomonadota bacterium]|nr:F0F1 ATP synthase subunit C [Pseudomonadota bacterium]
MELQVAKVFAAALAMLGTAGVGIGLGNLVSNWLAAIARNPGAAPQLQQTGIIGIALTEAIALFSLVVAMLILFVA